MSFMHILCYIFILKTSIQTYKTKNRKVGLYKQDENLRFKMRKYSLIKNCSYTNVIFKICQYF